MRSKVDSLLQKLTTLSPPSVVHHLTAFSGGIDSSLSLRLVAEAFPGRSKGVIGLSAALPEDMLLLAREVAQVVGVELVEGEKRRDEKRREEKRRGWQEKRVARSD